MQTKHKTKNNFYSETDDECELKKTSFGVTLLLNG